MSHVTHRTPATKPSLRLESAAGLVCRACLLGNAKRLWACGTAHRYFTSLGFRIPPRENPADWVIDVVCGLYDDGTVDAAFSAPAGLFAIWEERFKPRVFDPDFEWMRGFEPPAVLAGVAVVPLTPRRKPRRWKQAYYMMGRSFRQHDMPTLLVTCCILAGASALFAHLNATTAIGYTYPYLAQWVTGFAPRIEPPLSLSPLAAMAARRARRPQGIAPQRRSTSCSSHPSRGPSSRASVSTTRASRRRASRRSATLPRGTRTTR